MRKITQGVAEWSKKPISSSPNQMAKDNTGRNCGKKGHHHKECRNEVSCFYCKEMGASAVRLSNAEKERGQALEEGSAVDEQHRCQRCGNEQSSNTVAVVHEGGSKLEVDNPFILVTSMWGETCDLLALVDTGSPGSFIKYSIFKEFAGKECKLVRNVQKELRNLSNQTLNIVGLVEVELTLSPLNERKFKVILYVLNNKTFQGHIILGREFLTNEKLTSISRSLKVSARE